MTFLNLLAPKFRRQALIRRRVRQWLIIWILGLVAAGSVAAVRYYAGEREQRLLTELQRECAPLQDLEREISRMQARLDEIHGRESLLRMLKRADQPVQLIGIVSRATGSEVQDVYIEEFTLLPVRRNRIVETTDASGRLQRTQVPVEVMQLSLNGLGTDDLAVARFVAVLRESGVFDEVLLKSSTAVAMNPESGRRFLVDCQYR